MHKNITRKGGREGLWDSLSGTAPCHYAVYMIRSYRPSPIFSFWQSAVTHNSPADKTCEVLTWTAPPNGTGPVFFQWAVVVRYSTSGNVNMFYAPLQTMMINESEICRVLLQLNLILLVPYPDSFLKREPGYGTEILQHWVLAKYRR